MSLSPIGNSNATQADPNTSATSTSSTASPATNAAARSEPQSSTQVTLSPEAQVLAKINALGITMTTSSLAGLDLPPLSSLKTPADFAAVAQKLNSTMVTPPTDPITGKQDGEISQQDFENVARQYGETKTQADQLFNALDSDSSNSVSNEELLKGLSGTSSDPSGAVSQSLLGMMDTNHDGSVGQLEYLALETSFVAAEKAPD